MSEQGLQNEILDQIGRLPLEKQRQVLDFARALMEPSPRRPDELLSFGGTINTEDLTVMSRAIEQDCEQINADEW